MATGVPERVEMVADEDRVEPEPLRENRVLEKIVGSESGPSSALSLKFLPGPNMRAG